MSQPSSGSISQDQDKISHHSIEYSRFRVEAMEGTGLQITRGYGNSVQEWPGKKTIVAAPALVNLEHPLERGVNTGQIELEMVSLGTLAERVRAAKAGIGAFYSPTGVGTDIEKGKESRIIDGRKYLLEYPIKADFGLIRAHKGDRWGNLVYRKGSRSINATMAGAARITIAEVDEIVDLGDLDPELIVTPGIYVDRVVARPEYVERT